MKTETTKLSLLLFVLLLSGCKDPLYIPICKDSGEVRHTYFLECMSAAGKQPDHNHEDDNGHLVEACGSQAYYQTVSHCLAKSERMP